MKPTLRQAAAAATVASLALLAACNKPATDASDAAKTDAAPGAAAADGTLKIPGLETEKQQVSYVIGMQLAKNFEPIKDEIDVDLVAKAIKSQLAGEKPLLDEKQAQQINEAFGQKVQAKQIAKMMADAKKNMEEGAKFLADNAKKPGVQTTPSGLQYQVVTEGTGPKPKASDVVRVHYKGTLLDGKTFDSSYERGQPATFPLNAVVPGWQEGIALMPVGSKFKLWIPGNLGYGDKVPPGAPIGPNATLVFDVELLEIVKAPAQ